MILIIKKRRLQNNAAAVIVAYTLTGSIYSDIIDGYESAVSGLRRRKMRCGIVCQHTFQRFNDCRHALSGHNKDSV